MKKIFVILCAALVIAGCSMNKKTYTINGVLPDNSYDGKWVYMVDYSKEAPLDSALVTDGKFTFTGQPDIYNYIRLDLDRKLYANVIREAGEIQVDLSNPLSVVGTPLNDKKTAYSKELRDFYESARESGENHDTLHARFYSLNEAHFLPNTDNALGVFVFLSWYYDLSPEKVDSLYAIMGDSIKANPMVVRVIEANEHQKQTAVGKMFIDFTIEHGNLDGSAASFSDYIGKGKYVLVDFWAAWCGPCLAETPVIAEVYAKHKGDKFDVLGIAVWDKREKTLEAIKKHHIVWPQIIDAEEIPTKLYGINGIPQIMLFGPDGTILARDLRDDALKAKVAEVLK
ncbi:thiol:disulfide interchange protein [Bacteroidia bacterium]|nr:thiol:disulfide interchange protein [Bacteroidia bacterium]